MICELNVSVRTRSLPTQTCPPPPPAPPAAVKMETVGRKRNHRALKTHLRILSGRGRWLKNCLHHLVLKHPVRASNAHYMWYLRVFSENTWWKGIFIFSLLSRRRLIESPSLRWENLVNNLHKHLLAHIKGYASVVGFTLSLSDMKGSWPQKLQKLEKKDMIWSSLTSFPVFLAVCMEEETFSSLQVKSFSYQEVKISWIIFFL